MSNISSERLVCETFHADAPRDWLDYLSAGFLYYFFTTAIVVAAALLGRDLLPKSAFGRAKPDGDLYAFANWDGEWYSRIATEGYAYDPAKPSRVAFFPAYPLLARALINLTGFEPVASLLIVAHLSLIIAFTLTLAYVQLRCPEGGRELGEYVLLSFGLFPTAMFFRMAYSESLFVLLTVLCLYGMERRWPLFVLAVLVGFATAGRPVGLALVPPFVLHIWHRSPSARLFGVRLLWLLPLSLGGIVAYMGYQWQAFGEPLAFFKTQDNWHLYHPASLREKASALLTLEPIWSTFTPSSPAYWLRRTPHANPFASLSSTNTLFFIAAIILLGVGLRRQWLSSYEALLAGGLLLIPYVAGSYEMHMQSMGRFVAVIFPLHLVLGQILARLRGPFAALLLSVSACFLALYAALFAAWYPIY